MENSKENPKNGSAQPSHGSIAPKQRVQDNDNVVKEADPAAQRPAFGGDGGTNTSSREDQLPTLKDEAAKASDGAGEKSEQDQIKGSDADHDRGGKASV